MKWTGRFCLILIFLCGIYTGKSQEIIKVADSLYSVEQYGEAGLVYEWILYSANDPKSKEKALLGRINALKKLAYYDKALEYIDKANIVGLRDSTRAILIYESLLLNYLQHNYEEVQSRFLMSKFLLKPSQYYPDANLLLCLSQLKSGDWEKGIKTSYSYIQMAAPKEEFKHLIQNFEILLDTANTPKIKKAKTARILSMIIPGAGQVYAGYPIEGLTSFGLHILALGGAGFAFTQGLFVSGWVGGFGVLQKLYFGGNHKAAELTEQKNRLKKESFVQPAINFLISISEKYST